MTTTTRRRRRSALAATGAIVLAVLALVGVHLAGGSTSTAATTTASSAVAHGIQTIPAGVTDAVAAGTGTGPSALTGATSITAGGKPRVVYIGAEFCPYCAAERWAVVQALSRFGSFTGLGETRSSASDVYPSTASLSFHGATYTSSWLSFSGYETTTNQRQGGGYAPLDAVPADVQQLVSAAGAGSSIPFVDLGGAAVISGATYDPGLLQGLSQRQIVAALGDPSSPVAKAVLGTANRITAQLCTLTGAQPAAVCSAPGVTAAARA